MPRPLLDRMSRDYLQKQVDRTLSTLAQINARADVGDGRVLPSIDSLAIHDGKRIEATVLFLDICGFSQRPSETADEQQLQLRILSLFFTEMVRVIEDHSGFVEKNTGDGLMAYFIRETGDRETVQQRAMACVLTMVSAADRLINPILVRSGIPIIEFRVCLDSGPLTIAKVGAARGFNGIVAIGTTANIASKMLASAGPGMILIGARLAAKLPELWRVQYTELHSLETGWTYRGTGDPYPFWRYIGRWNDP